LCAKRSASRFAPQLPHSASDDARRARRPQRRPRPLHVEPEPEPIQLRNPSHGRSLSGRFAASPGGTRGSRPVADRPSTRSLRLPHLHNSFILARAVFLAVLAIHGWQVAYYGAGVIGATAWTCHHAKRLAQRRDYRPGSVVPVFAVAALMFALAWPLFLVAWAVRRVSAGLRARRIGRARP